MTPINLPRITSLLLLIITMSHCTKNPAKDADGQTAQFRNDTARTGLYAGADFNFFEAPQWVFSTGAAIRSTPVLYAGRLYIGCSDSNFYSIEAGSGREIWHFKASAAIHSSPAIAGGMAYFIDRQNNFYALKADDGALAWKLFLGTNKPYAWGFDYYQSSPLLAGTTAYVGSGDGSMYAIDLESRKQKWTFKTGAPVHSSPALADGYIYFGTHNGHVYALSAERGEVRWQFKTRGDTMNNEAAGFDRRAIIASPVISKGMVVIGGRDGYLYTINARTGKVVWDYNYDISWVVSSAAVKDSIVISATSDGHVINAFNLFTGRKIWEFNTGAPVFGSPVIVSKTIAATCNDGNIYCLDLQTGAEKHRYRIGDKFFSSPVFNDNTIYSANDNGNLYSLKVSEQPMTVVQKVVFWIKDPINQAFKNGMDVYIRDYFISSGYKLMGEDSLAAFMRRKLADTSVSSVIVFATNFFPEKISAGLPGETLLHQYLNKGGKVVVLGPNPAIYMYDFVKKEFNGFNYDLSKNILGIDYGFKDLRSFNGFYPSGPTDEGRRWGLNKTLVAHSGIDVSKVLPLALDETGRATYWVRNYSHKEGTGFVQLWINADNLSLLPEIKRVAEFGIGNLRSNIHATKEIILLNK